ncbi:DsbA family protein [Brevundimonas sp.]|uniref:DsbA family protein n=1 Tax=Brevundimonas sp. TaxID=1871086 RepID=UPI003919B921
MSRAASLLAAVILAAAPPSGVAAQTAGDAHQGHNHAPVAASTPVPAVTAEDRILGDPDAPVTVIEYASFTCGHCANWHEQVFPALKARFIDTGQVRFVHRDLPTAPRELAQTAALVARCATAEQFPAVVDALMSGQAAMYETRDADAWLMGAVEAGDLGVEQLQACLNDPEAGAHLAASVQGARDAGVAGTPTFFINGQPVDGDLASLEAAITTLIEQGG